MKMTWQERLTSVVDELAAQPLEAMEAFISLFDPLEVAKGESVIRAGEPTRQVYFVQDGVLRAFYTSSDGVEYNKTFFAENDLWGIYHALLSGQVSHLSVQALTPSRLSVADYGQVVSLYDQYPSLERFARRLAETLFIQKEQREIDLVTLDAGARYVKFQQLNPDLEQRIPQYHIASHLGVTPTQLSRIRAGFSLRM